jgi:hypothetical protein
LTVSLRHWYKGSAKASHASEAQKYVSFVRATQHKGDVATAQAVSTFTAAGYDVSIPLTESAAYDLIVDAGGELRRVQCKFSSTRDVDLRRIHSNSNGYVEKRVLLNAYDWLYVLRPDGSEFLIKECHVGRRAVTPRPEHRLVPVSGSPIPQSRFESAAE